MAEDKKGFILYADQKELFEQLPNEKAGELIKHIFKYVNDENPITEDLLINLAFTPIKQQFKRDLVKWETTREGRSKAGKASAEARKIKKQQTSTNLTNVDFVQQELTNPTVKDKVNVTVKDKVKVKETKSDENPITKFTEWFNSRRFKYLEIQSNFKKLSYTEQKELTDLKELYDTKDFEKAFINICNDKYCNEAKRIVPSHFLEYFQNYVSQDVKPLISKKQKINRGWAI